MELIPLPFGLKAGDFVVIKGWKAKVINRSKNGLEIGPREGSSPSWFYNIKWLTDLVNQGLLKLDNPFLFKGEPLREGDVLINSRHGGRIHIVGINPESGPTAGVAYRYRAPETAGLQSVRVDSFRIFTKTFEENNDYRRAGAKPCDLKDADESLMNSNLGLSIQKYLGFHLNPPVITLNPDYRYLTLKLADSLRVSPEIILASSDYMVMWDGERPREVLVNGETAVWFNWPKPKLVPLSDLSFEQMHTPLIQSLVAFARHHDSPQFEVNVNELSYGIATSDDGKLLPHNWVQVHYDEDGRPVLLESVGTTKIEIAKIIWLHDPEPAEATELSLVTKTSQLGDRSYIWIDAYHTGDTQTMAHYQIVREWRRTYEPRDSMESTVRSYACYQDGLGASLIFTHDQLCRLIDQKRVYLDNQSNTKYQDRFDLARSAVNAIIESKSSLHVPRRVTVLGLNPGTYAFNNWFISGGEHVYEFNRRGAVTNIREDALIWLFANNLVAVSSDELTAAETMAIIKTNELLDDKT